MHAKLALYAIPALLSAVYATDCADTVSPSCLIAEEVPGIANRWLNLFLTDGSGLGIAASPLISTTVEDNITVYDQAYSKGSDAPYITGAAQLTSLVATGYGRLFSGAIITNITYETQFVFNGCDRIGLRWRSDGYASRQNGTAAAGTAVSYSGTDTIRVSLSSRLIYNVTTSSDRLVLYRQLGITTFP